eukprot:339675_1
MSSFSVLFFATFSFVVVVRGSQPSCSFVNEPGHYPGTYESYPDADSSVIIPAGPYSLGYCNFGYPSYSWNYSCCDIGDDICVDIYVGSTTCDPGSATYSYSYSFNSTQRDYNCNEDALDCSLSYAWYNNGGYNTSCDLDFNYAAVSLVNGGCAYYSIGDYYYGYLCD